MKGKIPTKAVSSAPKAPTNTPKVSTNNAPKMPNTSNTPNASNSTGVSADNNTQFSSSTPNQVLNQAQEANKQNQGEAAPPGAKPGDKVAPGKVVGEDGKVEDSDVKEGLNAAINVASLFTGGAAGAAKQAGAQAAKQGAKQAASQAAKQAGKQAASQAGKQAGKQAAGQAAKGAGAGNRNLLSQKPGGGGGMAKMGGNNPIKKKAMEKVGTAIDKGVGKAADKLEKSETIKKFAKDNKEEFKTINKAFDAVGAAMSGDKEGLKDSVKELKKNGKKVAKKAIKKHIIRFVLPMIPGILGFLILIVIIILPFEGGYLALTDFVEGVGEVISNAWSYITDSQDPSDDLVKSVIGDVPGYDSLSQNRKNILLAASLAIGTKYNSTGKPQNATVDGISNGINAGGFAEWLIWNVSGGDPGNLSGSAIRSSSKFTSISESELQPGDFGVSGENVGIYFGNGEWVIVDSSEGVVRTKYSGFTSFYKYKDIDSSSSVINPAPTTSTAKVNAVLAAANQAYNNKIPYEWGGKASNAGISGNGFGDVLTSSNSSYYDYNIGHSHYYNGLDCSSFIAWIVWTGIGDTSLNGGTTKTIKANHATPISSSDLKAGDIGYYSDYSHVGIYAGNGMWYHQGSGGDYKSANVNGQSKMSKGYTKYVTNPGFVNYYRLKALV